MRKLPIPQRTFLPLLMLALLWLSACTRPASTVDPLGLSSLPAPTGSAEGLSGQNSTPSGIEPTLSLPETNNIESNATIIAQAPIPVQEVRVTRIPLAGALASSDAEISSMAWYGDQLVFLPQYPGRFDGGEDGALFSIPGSVIRAFLDGETPGPLEPQPVPFFAPGLLDQISGYEGFEAIAFYEDRVFLTIESRPKEMMGYLVQGTVSTDLSQIVINSGSLTAIPPQSPILNLSDESIIFFGDRLVTLYEANGREVNPHPIAHMFDLDLNLRDTLAFPNVEYRITDATPADESGRFWAINFFFPGDTKLQSAEEPLAEEYGRGETHARNLTVERLLEFQFSEAGIELADFPPIQIELLGDAYPRNWEAIARLEGKGFLLATDKFPETIFGFIPSP